MSVDVEREDGHMTETRCPIWGTPAFEYPSHGDGKFIDSPRAGGKYLVAGTAAAILENCDDLVKARLTSWLIEQRQLGIKWVEIYSPTISEAQQRQALGAPECADGILRYLRAKSKSLGTIVRYSVFIGLYDKSLMTPTIQEKECLCLLAHSESINMDDLSVLMEHLEDTGLIKISGDDKVKGCNLTVAGYARLAELEKTNVVSSKAFIAMQFNDPNLDAFVKDIVKPAVGEIGYDLVDMRDVAQAGVIDNIMRAQIRDVAFAIVDLSHDNLGAYWEAGYAEGLGKPVIYICEKTKFKEESTHFDTNHCTTILWSRDNDTEFRDKLTTTILRSLEGSA